MDKAESEEESRSLTPEEEAEEDEEEDEEEDDEHLAENLMRMAHLYLKNMQLRNQLNDLVRLIREQEEDEGYMSL